MEDLMQPLKTRLYLADRDREARELLRAKEAGPAGRNLRSVLAAWIARLTQQVVAEPTTHSVGEP